MLGLLAALSTLTIAMYIPGFHQMANDFKVSENQIAFTLTSYFIGITVGQLIYGPIIDKYGRKNPLLISLCIFIVSSIGCSLANSLNILILLRFIQAIGASAGMVSALAIITDVFEPAERPKAFSLVMTVLGVAPIVSPSLGSFFVAAYNWEAVFYAITVYGAVVVFLIFMFLPETARYASPEKLRIKQVLANYGSVLKNKIFSLHAIGGSMANAVIFAFVAASPAIFMGFYKVTPKEFGLLYGISATGAMMGNYLNGVLVKKIHSRKMMMAGALSLFALTSAVALITYFADGFPYQAMVVTLFFILLCVGLIYPNTINAALSPFKELAGSASALNGSLMMAMSALITAIIGALSTSSPFTMFAIMVAASALVLVFLQMAKQRQ